MVEFTGRIVAGEVDAINQSFYLTQVKNLETKSQISRDQLNQIYQYLKQQDDSCMLTINDQIPVLLQEKDINAFMYDLTQIKNSMV